MNSCEGDSNNVRAGCANGKSNMLELQGHIMHGVFHSNGFGHLLSVNGVEMDSDLAGHLIMAFWDRLCTGLRARLVSFSIFWCLNCAWTICGPFNLGKYFRSTHEIIYVLVLVGFIKTLCLPLNLNPTK